MEAIALKVAKENETALEKEKRKNWKDDKDALRKSVTSETK